MRQSLASIESLNIQTKYIVWMFVQNPGLASLLNLTSKYENKVLAWIVRFELMLNEIISSDSLIIRMRMIVAAQDRGSRRVTFAVFTQQ
jgi:hypothetical protein